MMVSPLMRAIVSYHTQSASRGGYACGLFLGVGRESRRVYLTGRCPRCFCDFVGTGRPMKGMDQYYWCFVVPVAVCVDRSPRLIYLPVMIYSRSNIICRPEQKEFACRFVQHEEHVRFVCPGSSIFDSFE